ncbi:MAG: hypothetical protein M1816_000649 [Peltula sp. TS41687]|nr:MAG: hypothetical protein M1816_000649 [Peltula sp. TS41687]
MPGFEDLSNEVIKLILEALPQAACAEEPEKSIHEYPWSPDVYTTLATPFLYRSVTHNFLGNTLRRFLRTMCLRPDLAPHVSSVDLNWERGRGGHGSSRAIDTDDRLDIDTAARIGDANLINALENKSEEAQVILLLNQLPAVRTIEMTPPPSDRPLFDAVMKSVMGIDGSLASLPQGLRSVRNLRWPEVYTTDDNDMGLQFMALIYGLLLPSIISTTGLEIFVETWPFDDVQTESHKTSPVQSLTFDNCQISVSVLDQLLRIPKELREFSLSIRDVLPDLPGSSSLKTLAKRSDKSGENSIGSLRDFPKLAFVDTTLRALLGVAAVRADRGLVEMLPPNLEELVLFIEEQYSKVEVFLDYGLEVIASAKTHLPRLKRITLLFEERAKEEYLDQLKRAAAKEDLELAFQRPWEDDTCSP